VLALQNPAASSNTQCPAGECVLACLRERVCVGKVCVYARENEYERERMR
jgi:hypothetical protein